MLVSSLGTGRGHCSYGLRFKRAWWSGSLFVLFAMQFIACLANTENPESVGTTSDALVVSGLFATGVDAGGTALVSGSNDPHYTLSSTDVLFPGPDAIAVNRATGWVANTATSKWISVQASTQGSVGGVYTYTTTFTLTGVDPTTAQITGQWACDDSCTVSLNGTLVASRKTPAWGSAAMFTIPAPSPFKLGSNTLAFTVSNTTGGPTGLQILSISGSVSGCTADNQCSAAQFCNTQTATCVSKIPNGTAVPTITGHNPALTGVCSAAVGTAVCVATACDATDNECGVANSDPCTSGTVCRSGACSTNMTCEPAGGCNVDADCTGGKWCSESTHTCNSKLANGTAIPSDPPHTNPTLNGSCTVLAGTLVCSSGVCDTTDSKCGYADGDGICTVLTAMNVCRSGVCSIIGKCEPSGGCDSDGDCMGGTWCNESTRQCKAKIANGGGIPNDPPHTNPTLNGACNAGAATLVCQSAVCDGATNECVQCTASNAGACAGSTPVCGPADTCVAADGGAGGSSDAGGGSDASGNGDAGGGTSADAGGDGSAGTNGDASSDAGADGSAAENGDASSDAGGDASAGTDGGSSAEGGQGEDASFGADGGTGDEDAEAGQGSSEDSGFAGSGSSGSNGSGVLEGGGLSCAVSRNRSSDSSGAPLLMLAVVFGAALGRGRRNR